MDYAIKPFAIAFCFVLVALLWTFPLQHVMAYPFVFLFFGAIMGSAWFGGAISGFLAVVVSSFLINFLFIPPLYSINVAKEFRSFFAAFILCAFAIAVVSSARKRAEMASRAARDQLEAKVRERTAELERSNLETKESERQLRVLTEAIPQQIWRANANGRIEYCNQHLREYIGGQDQDYLGDSFFDILHPLDEPTFRQGWSAAIGSGGGFEIEARVRRRDGEYRWFLIRSIPQLFEDGRIARWYGIDIDIEEQHRAQQSLQVAQESISRLARTLSMAEMAASIAHELNQPLAALMNDANACRRWLNNEPVNLQRAVATTDRIVRECTRASAVVSRVRSLFTKGEYLREPTDLNALIRDLTRLLRDDAIRHHVSFKLNLAEHIQNLDIDAVQIQQVLMNLAKNGMDAMFEVEGVRELEISSQMQEGDEVQVTVKDSGCGLDAETRTRIFEPFFTTKPEGTGMGLSICRSIIEAHRGRIWAEPLARGTAFHFTLGLNA
jgi:PAS domain S-box-containing protein